jgi:hypothetical protein
MDENISKLIIPHVNEVFAADSGCSSWHHFMTKVQANRKPPLHKSNYSNFSRKFSSSNILQLIHCGNIFNCLSEN